MKNFSRPRRLVGAAAFAIGLLLIPLAPAGAAESAAASSGSEAEARWRDRAGDRDSRIIGGTKPAAGQWPAQAALLFSSVPNPAEAQFCGGTVIAPTWVLTAAHCVAEPGWQTDPDDVDVLVGTHDLRSGGWRVRAQAVYVRSDFDYDWIRNDFALIQLSRAVPVAPDLEVAGRTDIPWSGARLRTAGWGMTESGRGAVELREVEVPAMAPDECRTALTEATTIAGTPPYHSSHLCTGPVGTGGRGPCYGDSGGPLVWETGGRRVLVGIVSWGAYCGSPETPSVFAKVASASDWIRRTIEIGPHYSYRDLRWTIDESYLELDFDESPVGNVARFDPGVYIAGLHDKPAVTRRDATVVRLYQAVLGRRAEAWGYQYWRQQMAFRGIGAVRVAEVMALSAEFRATYGSLDDAAFVSQIYANVLGRPGAGGDVAYWTGQLGSGSSRGKVVAQIAESAENRARTKAAVDVDVAFLNIVRRQPAAWERAEWAGRPVAELGRSLVLSQAYARIWQELAGW